MLRWVQGNKYLRYAAASIAFIAVLGLSYVGTNQTASALPNPNMMNFQGKVVNSDGTNVTNGSYTFRFRLYTSTAPTDAANVCSANSCKWEESKTVTVTNGVFQTELGDTTTMIDVSLYTDLYLGVRFNNDAAGEMTPRVHLNSVAYALNADKVGGIGAAGFVQLGATQSGNINIGTGTITSGNINSQTIGTAANFTGTLTIQGANALALGTSSTNNASILFRSSGGANTITLTAPTTNPTSSYVLRLPTTAPALSQCLQNDGTTIGQLTFGSCGSGGGGDSISVNGTAATDANFLNTTATGTVTGTTFTLNTGATPNTVAVAIGNASTTTAGAVTNAAQTFAGDKTFQSTTNSTTAFRVQNSSGSDILSVDTTDTNLIANNPGFEAAITGWTAANTTAPTRVTTTEYLGIASGAVTAVTAAGEGFRQVLASALPNGTYTISWYDKLISGPAFTDVRAAYSATGGAAVDCTGQNSAVVVTTGWTRHWCQITVSGASASNFITIRQVGASAARTWNIDAVQLELGAAPTAYGAGTLSINSNIISPINFKNAEDSTTAFQIQSSNGTNLATFDTLNKGLTFQGDINLNAQTDIRFADTDSSNWVALQAPDTVTSNVTWKLPSADAAGCLKSDGSGNLSISPCGDTNVQTLSANGFFTIPVNGLITILEAWGGGGGGAGGTGNSLAASRSGGGGGGGGAYNTTTIVPSSLGLPNANIPVTVGGGGTAGNGGTTNLGTVGGAGGQTCLSSTSSCGGTMFIQTFGGGGGASVAVGNGGGGGGGSQAVGGNSTSVTGGTGGGPGGSGATASNAAFGGGGGSTATTGTFTVGTGVMGGGGGGASTTTGVNNSGPGGGSYQGGAGGGGGASTPITTYVQRSGGQGGRSPILSGGGGGGTAGSTAGQAGGPGSSGVGGGGDGGGGGGSTGAVSGVGGAGGVGGTRGGGGGGGGASAGTGTQVGGAGGVGGSGFFRATTLRGQGADLAEIYCTNDSDMVAGDAVSIDPALRAGVRKTTKPYDNTAIGVISTAPGLTIGTVEEECAKPVLVALAGRVPLKVSLENGPIKSGDSLAASSIPGVAMKAVKAGTVIGQALTAYDGQPADGYVVAFVQNHVSNGSSLAEFIPGLDTNQDVPVSQQALEYLLTKKDEAVASQYVSEITTDRVTAGLEIITPSVITDALTTNSIGSSGGDISFILGDSNKLVVKGRAGEPAFSIDATGNATFGVSLVALGDIEAKGGLIVDGDALFNGIATFTKLAQFQGDIDALGRVTFNKDAGGLGLLTKGGTRVDIVFDKPYERPPVVAVTLVADQTVLPNGTIEDSKLKEQRLFAAGYSYLVSNSTTKGFTIVLNKKASENLQFSWNAVAIKDPTTTTGDADTTEAPAVLTSSLAEGQ
ncbi:MAG TPA: hypothetical protein VF575_03155 [Candidatus Saccharimonadales bacterium]|jgi:hypothetical protein